VGHAAVIVIDTHVLVWWLTQHERLSPAARLALAQVNATNPAVLSAISILEITTAVRRGRMDLSVPIGDWLTLVRQLPELRIEAVSSDIAARAGGYGDDMHGDPADRIVAATAELLGARLVSADEKLRQHPAVQALW
jgi:PIN domain nuclease of toxin-antitoxin system